MLCVVNLGVFTRKCEALCYTRSPAVSARVCVISLRALNGLRESLCAAHPQLLLCLTVIRGRFAAHTQSMCGHIIHLWLCRKLEYAICMQFARARERKREIISVFNLASAETQFI